MESSFSRTGRDEETFRVNQLRMLIRSIYNVLKQLALGDSFFVS